MEAISKAKIKWIRSLQQKKHRESEGYFVVEGYKMLQDALSMNIKPSLVVCPIFAIQKNEFLKTNLDSIQSIVTCSELELDQMSALKTPNSVISVFKVPFSKPAEIKRAVLLDGVQDPGNLGTILRTCAWFGINDIICSKETVDCYNSKVVQASMGAIFVSNIIYVDLPEFLSNSNIPVFAADMCGQNYATFNFPERFLLLMGNEGHGIRTENEAFVTAKITIPKIGFGESLNVGVALSVILGRLS
jgi:RNA methyltransferase, TrmH family